MSNPPSDVIKTLSEEARSRECAFCLIASNSPAFDPAAAAPESNEDGGGGGESADGHAHIVLSTPDVIAFLDIMPLTRCHLLVCPRMHREKLSHLSPAENAIVGAWLPILSRAACRVSGYDDFNVVQNNGVDAAQVVPHVHYHIIPRPNERQREKLEATTPEDRKRWWKSPFGSGWRTDLYDEEGEQLAAALRAEVKREVEDLQRDPQKRSDTRFLASL